MTHSIKKSEISVVVQGAIDKKLTPIVLQSVRKYLSEAQIILSTWKGSNVKNLDYDTLVLNDDPGGYKMSHGSEINNVKRQIISTLNGIKAVDNSKRYVLKLRSDIALTGDNFLKYFDKYNCFNDDWRFVKSRIIISSIASRDPTEWECPFCISDWIHFGLKEDLLRLWDIQLPSDEEINWFNGHCRDINTIYKNNKLISRFNPEQHIIINFLKKFKKEVNCRHMFDSNSISIEQTLLTCANNFVILSPKKYNFSFLKKTRPGADRWHILTHKKWLKIYNKFSGANENIPLIDFERISYIKHFYKAKKRIYKKLFLERKRENRFFLLKNNNKSSKDLLMSVVIPSHDRLTLLNQTLESLYNQTSNQFEIIITDDSRSGNREQISNIIKNHSKNYNKNIKFTYIYSGQSIGQVKNTNFGLKHAKCQLVRILHSDDVLHPRTIEDEIHYFEKYGEKIDVLFHKNIVFTNRLPIFSQKKTKYKLLSYEELVDSFLITGCAVPSGLVFTKKILDEIGLMNSEYKRACDWDFFYRMIHHSHKKNLKVLSVNRKYLGYRNHLNNNTNSEKLSFINFKEYEKIHTDIINDCINYKIFSPKKIIHLKKLSRNYRYNRLLEEIKSSNNITASQKEMIWNYISNQNDLELFL